MEFLFRLRILRRQVRYLHEKSSGRGPSEMTSRSPTALASSGQSPISLVHTGGNKYHPIVSRLFVMNLAISWGIGTRLCAMYGKNETPSILFSRWHLEHWSVVVGHRPSQTKMGVGAWHLAKKYVRCKTRSSTHVTTNQLPCSYASRGSAGNICICASMLPSLSCTRDWLAFSWNHGVIPKQYISVHCNSRAKHTSSLLSSVTYMRLATTNILVWPNGLASF